MSKDLKEEDESKWTYDGKEEDWDMFDRKMVRHMIKNYDEFGEQLWLGNIKDFNTMEFREYDLYCTRVWRAIDVKDSSKAIKLWNPASGFWTMEWQRIWIERQLRLMVGYIEEHAKGQVLLEIINFDGNKMEIRKHLYK